MPFPFFFSRPCYILIMYYRLAQYARMYPQEWIICLLQVQMDLQEMNSLDVKKAFTENLRYWLMVKNADYFSKSVPLIKVHKVGSENFMYDLNPMVYYTVHITKIWKPLNMLRYKTWINIRRHGTIFKEQNRLKHFL